MWTAAALIQFRSQAWQKFWQDKRDWEVEKIGNALRIPIYTQ